MWPCPEIEKGWIQYCSSMITEAAVIQLPKHAQTFRLFLLCTALVIMCFIVSTGLQLWHDHAISTTIPHNSHTIPLPLSSTETHQIDFALQLQLQTSSQSFKSLAALYCLIGCIKAFAFSCDQFTLDHDADSEQNWESDTESDLSLHLEILILIWRPWSPWLKTKKHK